MVGAIANGEVDSRVARTKRNKETMRKLVWRHFGEVEDETMYDDPFISVLKGRAMEESSSGSVGCLLMARNRPRRRQKNLVKREYMSKSLERKIDDTAMVDSSFCVLGGRRVRTSGLGENQQITQDISKCL